MTLAGGHLQPTWQFSLQSYSLIVWPLQDTGFKYVQLQPTVQGITPLNELILK